MRARARVCVCVRECVCECLSVNTQSFDGVPLGHLALPVANRRVKNKAAEAIKLAMAVWCCRNTVLQQKRRVAAKEAGKGWELLWVWMGGRKV